MVKQKFLAAVVEQSFSQKQAVEKFENTAKMIKKLIENYKPKI